MIALIVTDTHKNRGSVLDMQFTDHSKLYSDGTEKLYTMNDFVDLDTVLHEYDKAERMIEYWTLVAITIREHLAKHPKGDDEDEKSVLCNRANNFISDGRLVERHAGQPEEQADNATS